MLSLALPYRWLGAALAAITLNMDEASVERAVPHGGGQLLNEMRRSRRTHLQEQMGDSFLLPFVHWDSYRDHIRHCLPQVLMSNNHALTVARRTKLGDPPAPLLWQQGSAWWLTSASALTRLRRTSWPRAPHAHIVLVMDYATPRLTYEVLTHLARLGSVYGRRGLSTDMVGAAAGDTCRRSRGNVFWGL